MFIVDYNSIRNIFKIKTKYIYILFKTYMLSITNIFTIYYRIQLYFQF